MGKRGLDMSEFSEESFEVKGAGSKDADSNNFDADQHPDENRTEASDKAPGELLDSFRDIFDGSLDKNKKLRTTAVVFTDNMERINALSELVEGKSKTDCINYIINEYFRIYADQFKKDYSKYMKERKKLF